MPQMQHEQYENAEMLAKKCSNRMLEKIEIVHKNDPAGYHDFCKSLPCKIVGVGIHNDLIFWILDGDFSVWLKPSPTCSWKEKPTNCTRIKMVMDDSEICYDDAHGFSVGILEFVSGRSSTLKRLRSLNTV